MNIHSQADCFDLDWTPSVIVLCCKYMSHTLFTLHLLVRSHISLPLPPFSNSSVVDTVLLMRRILLLTHRISWLGSLTTPQGIQLAESWIQFNVFKGSCFVSQPVLFIRRMVYPRHNLNSVTYMYTHSRWPSCCCKHIPANSSFVGHT